VNPELGRALSEPVLLLSPQRTYRAIVSGSGESVEGGGHVSVSLNRFTSGSCDQMKEDAVAALEYIRRLVNDATTGSGPG
jgi:hypothetical protein